MTTAHPKPRPPANLGPAGRGLWRQLTAEYVFAPAETPVLAAACRQLDTVADLDAAVAAEGVLTTGSRQQTVVHPAVQEARLGRVAVARLLSSLSIPDEQDRPRTAASLRGQKAAESRWARQRASEERREQRLAHGEV